MISYDIYLSLSDLLSKIISRSIHVAANGIFKYILMIWYLCIVQNFYKIDLHPVVNVHHHRDLYLFLLVIRTFTIDSLSNFQMYSTVLLITVTMLYIASPWFTYFITGSFYILTCFTHFVHPPCLCLWQLPISLSMSLVSFSEVFSPKEFLVFCPHEFRLSMLNSPLSTFSVITHFFVLLIMCCAVLSRLVVSDSLGPHRL